MNRKSLMQRLFVALFALALMSGASFAQDAAKPAAKTEKPSAAAAADLLDHQHRDQGTADRSAGNR